MVLLLGLTLVQTGLSDPSCQKNHGAYGDGDRCTTRIANCGLGEVCEVLLCNVYPNPTQSCVNYNVNDDYTDTCVEAGCACFDGCNCPCGDLLGGCVA